MMLVLSVAIAIFSVFLLKDNKEDFDSLEPIPSVNSILPADIDQVWMQFSMKHNFFIANGFVRYFHRSFEVRSSFAKVHVTDVSFSRKVQARRIRRPFAN